MRRSDKPSFTERLARSKGQDTQAQTFYVISIKWTLNRDSWVTFFRPNSAGYAWALEASGVYSREEILSQPGYLNNGWQHGTRAISADVVQSLAVRVNQVGDYKDCLHVANTPEFRRILMKGALPLAEANQATTEESSADQK